MQAQSQEPGPGASETALRILPSILLWGLLLLLLRLLRFLLRLLLPQPLLLPLLLLLLLLLKSPEPSKYKIGKPVVISLKFSLKGVPGPETSLAVPDAQRGFAPLCLQQRRDHGPRIAPQSCQREQQGRLTRVLGGAGV